jgi:hypothetical protein
VVSRDDLALVLTVVAALNAAACGRSVAARDAADAEGPGPAGAGPAGTGSAGAGAAGAAAAAPEPDAGAAPDVGEAGDAPDAGHEPDAPADGPTQTPREIRVAGGDPNGLYCDLVVEGEGLEQFEGKWLEVQNQASPYHRTLWGRTRISGGKFSMTFPQASEPVPYYGALPIMAVVGTDGAGGCVAGLRSAVVTWDRCDSDGRVKVRFDAAAFASGRIPSCSSLYSWGCSSLLRLQREFVDLHLTGRGLADVEGRIVKVVARDEGTLALTGHAAARVVHGGFTAYIPRGRPRGAAQKLFWFIDADADRACGAGDVGGVGAAPAGDDGTNDPVEAVLDAAPSVQPGVPAFCSGFPPRGALEVQGTGFEVDEGVNLRLNVRARGGGALLAAESAALVSAGVARFAQTLVYEPGAQVELLWIVGPGSAPCDAGVCARRGHQAAGPLQAGADGVFRVDMPKENSLTTAAGESVAGIMAGCL